MKYVFLLLLTLFLCLDLSAQALDALPTIDQPQEFDKIHTYTRGFSAAFRLDTLRKYFSADIVEGVAVNPYTAIPDSLRGRYFISTLDSLYYVDYLGAFVNLTPGTGGGGGTTWNDLTGIPDSIVYAAEISTNPDVAANTAKRTEHILYAADFGVDTSTTDNREGIQAAIDSASNLGGGVVFLPKGVLVVGKVDGYPVGSFSPDHATADDHSYSIILKPGVTVRGEGAGLTTIRLANNVQALRANDLIVSVNASNVGIESLTLDGNAESQTDYITNHGNSLIASLPGGPYGQAVYGNGWQTYGGKNITATNVRSINHFGNVMNIYSESDAEFKNIVGQDCGEGLQFFGSDTMRRIEVDGYYFLDSIGVLVGDGLEFSRCAEVTALNGKIFGNRARSLAGFGGAGFDVYGVDGLYAKNFVIKDTRAAATLDKYATAVVAPRANIQVTNVIMKDFEVIGTTLGTGSLQFMADTMKNVIVDSWNFVECASGITISPTRALTTGKVFIRNCTVIDATTWGLKVNAGDDVNIIGGEYSGNGTQGIHITPHVYSAFDASNLTVTIVGTKADNNFQFGLYVQDEAGTGVPKVNASVYAKNNPGVGSGLNSDIFTGGFNTSGMQIVNLLNRNVVASATTSQPVAGKKLIYKAGSLRNLTQGNIGQELTIIASAALTVDDVDAFPSGNIQLEGTSLSLTSGQALTLVLSGVDTLWHEISRSAALPGLPQSRIQNSGNTTFVDTDPSPGNDRINMGLASETIFRAEPGKIAWNMPTSSLVNDWELGEGSATLSGFFLNVNTTSSYKGGININDVGFDFSTNSLSRPITFSPNGTTVFRVFPQLGGRIAIGRTAADSQIDQQSQISAGTVHRIRNQSGQSIYEMFHNSFGNGGVILRNSTGENDIQILTYGVSHIKDGLVVGANNTGQPGKLHVAGNAAITGGLDMTSTKITSLATPTATTDAANKAYVDAQVTAGGADNLGNHTATTNLLMGGNAITWTSDFTNIAGTSGTARFGAFGAATTIYPTHVDFALQAGVPISGSNILYAKEVLSDGIYTDDLYKNRIWLRSDKDSTVQTPIDRSVQLLTTEDVPLTFIKTKATEQVKTSGSTTDFAASLPRGSYEVTYHFRYKTNTAGGGILWFVNTNANIDASEGGFARTDQFATETAWTTGSDAATPSTVTNTYVGITYTGVMEIDAATTVTVSTGPNGTGNLTLGANSYVKYVRIKKP